MSVRFSLLQQQERTPRLTTCTQPFDQVQQCGLICQRNALVRSVFAHDSLSAPLRSIALVGEHAEAVWKDDSLVPSLASRSMFGVGISLPKQPTSENPRSSATMIRKFGFFSSTAPILSNKGQRGSTSDCHQQTTAFHLFSSAGQHGGVLRGSADRGCCLGPVRHPVLAGPPTFPLRSAVFRPRPRPVRVCPVRDGVGRHDILAHYDESKAWMALVEVHKGRV